MVGQVNNTAQAQAAVTQALATIRADFIDGLVPLINELEYQQHALSEPDRVPQALDSIQKVAHKVSGMAGGVGFTRLGDEAAEIDMGVIKLSRGGFNPRVIPGLQARLETFMDLMEDALDAEA